MKSQWECFLGNLGVWDGSFTTFSPEGELLEDISSRISFEGLNENQELRLTLEREGKQDIVLNFTKQGIGGIIFLDNGAFSQAPVQFNPYSQFGGELGLIHQNRRLRIVQTFDSNCHIKRITLIREYRSGTETVESPQLKVDDLLGEWHGEAFSISPTLEEKTFNTKMHLRLNNGRLEQTTTYGGKTLTSSATVNSSVLAFDQNSDRQVNVLLLPGGASATFPVKAQLGKPLFIESGWLINPNLRQRMIRMYNTKGEWVSLTLVTEKKVD
ncbi:MAG: DUF3598 family protein [Cyanobacteria bacterium P01_A01_bin.84]